ncbi:MAG: UvrD-helicase domain-containing protein [Gammaproteobacteria bacterium]|nr:UvrD-helicase domain-containing protein [Gammaproteobacteria bacterium]
MADPQSVIPQVADEDVEWICRIMGLREFDQSRQKFLRARTTLDVSACPGSGKTTLIVAKLAMMARKWPHRTKGICVLSHTNAAREENQRRLRGTVVGQQLLAYPHFIDTIHGFVNRFLALPWLNSNGFPVATIDDDVATAYRRRAIGERGYHTVQSFLEKRYSGFDKLRIRDRDLRFDIGKPFPAGPNTKTHKFARQAIEAATSAGFFCYDEMFVWAKALLQDCPAVAHWLQRRFPLVIIDEMQDTSELQVGVVATVFRRDSSEVVVQRVGDPNQAIYDGAPPDAEGADVFPDPDRCLEIPNSFRFGPSIAALASPFAVNPVGPNGLQGVGPRTVRNSPECCPHAVFVFPDESPTGALDMFGHHVLSVFSDSALAEGAVSAVGAVHRAHPEIKPGHDHYPKTVPHYWSGYTAEIARRDPHPESLIQYVRVAQAAVRDGHDLSSGVEKIASGVSRLAHRIGDASRLGRRVGTHRVVANGLKGDPRAASAYRDLLCAFLMEWMPLTSATWNVRKAEILSIARALCETVEDEGRAAGFLYWDEHDPSLMVDAPTSPTDAGPNVYRVADECGRRVDICLGSIHSVKGQTHLATLLLNTFRNGHSSQKLLPWLLGENVNGGKAGAQNLDRLLQTYVAMTRPSHLVCLAVPRSALGDDAALNGHLQTLKARGWHVAEVVNGSPRWYS